MLEEGGRHIEDLREIRDDTALRQLVRMGAIRAVNGAVAETIHRRTGTSDYTPDVDVTVIEAEKQEAEWT